GGVHSGWQPKDSQITIAGRLLNGMIFIGPARKEGAQNRPSRAFIDPTLPVAPAQPGSKISASTAAELRYWPSYAEISPSCRGAYLDWLADGAGAPNAPPGFVLMYFYGLERRYFIDQPSGDERTEICDEVRRLARTYPDFYEVKTRLNTFLDFVGLANGALGPATPRISHVGYQLPVSLRAALGLMVSQGAALRSEWVLAWFLNHPARRLSPDVKNYETAFLAMFTLIFERAYPAGLPVAAPQQLCTAQYNAASDTFTSPSNLSFPDITGLQEPIAEAQKVADAAFAALGNYSHYLGRHMAAEPDLRNSAAAQIFLPRPLWPVLPSDQAEALQSWAMENVQAGGFVPLEELLTRLEGAPPQRFTYGQLDDAAAALALLGFGLAPDIRFSPRSPRLDEPVLLYLLPRGAGGPQELPKTASVRYRAALVQMAFGAFIAHADGRLLEQDDLRLEPQAGLSAAELASLRANLEWMSLVPPDFAFLRWQLRNCTASQKPALQMLALSMTQPNAAIAPETIGGAQSIYQWLSVDPAMPAFRRASYQAEPPEAEHPVTPEQIVQELPELAQLFGQLPKGTAPSARQDSFAGLDVRHKTLLRLLVERPLWYADDYGALLAQHGLNPSDTTVRLNEWAMRWRGCDLLRQADGLHVDAGLAAEIIAELV
ncbi:MAG: TerB N-terminal domain-containing protein, partial [Rhodobacteraceae bacterium]|nr:TerB N-terminal domain-containing protein [Paracoccaceae bacterium]